MHLHSPISTDHAPQAIGPYSQAIRAGNYLFVSGQLPLDPTTGALIEGDISEKTVRIFKNISEIITAAGGDMTNIVKVTLFLTDLSDFGAVNETYGQLLQSPYPARSTIQVAALPLGAPIEAEVVAYIP